MPPSRTTAIGASALISQLMRSQGGSGRSSLAESRALAESRSETFSSGEEEPAYSVLKKLLRAGAEPTGAAASVEVSQLVDSRVDSGISTHSRQQYIMPKNLY